MTTAILLPAWAITATAVAGWATWRVYRLRDRSTRYLTAVLESGDAGIEIAATAAKTKDQAA